MMSKSLFCLNEKNTVQVVECQVSSIQPLEELNTQIPLKWQFSNLAAHCDYLGKFQTY